VVVVVVVVKVGVTIVFMEKHKQHFSCVAPHLFSTGFICTSISVRFP